MKNIFIITFVMVFSSRVLAWGDLGHATIGYIAEKNLTPAAQKMIQNIIGIEPLAVAANWPDVVRPDERFKDFATYHYVEDKNDKDARVIIERAPLRILDKKSSREEKMIWLRYIIHVIGDLHQPLHVGNGYDRGGNTCEVKWIREEGSSPEITNLHSFWDEKIIAMIQKDFEKKNPPPAGKKRWFDYVDLKEIVLKGSGETMKSANTVKPQDWYAEAKSYHDQIYPDAKPTDPKNRAYCKSGVHTKDEIPLLDKAYIQKNIPLVKKQLVKAGYRLAQFLNELGIKYVKNLPKDAKIMNAEDFILKNKKSY